MQCSLLQLSPSGIGRECETQLLWIRVIPKPLCLLLSATGSAALQEDPVRNYLVSSHVFLLDFIKIDFLEIWRHSQQNPCFSPPGRGKYFPDTSFATRIVFLLLICIFRKISCTCGCWSRAYLLKLFDLQIPFTCELGEKGSIQTKLRRQRGCADSEHLLTYI